MFDSKQLNLLDYDHPDAYEHAIFRYLLHPADSYTEGTNTYWADLSLKDRVRFILSVNSAESEVEFESLTRMFKENMFNPILYYFNNSVLPGMGMLLEGYVLFSIGNLKGLFTSATTEWQDCWKTNKTCSKHWTASLDYLEIAGIITGQVLVGLIGDVLGRRWGMIQDAVVMAFGLLLLTAMWGTSMQAWVIFYAFALYIYSIGVGGEYPMTAAGEMEKTNQVLMSTRDDRLHRGRTVQMAFLMQGWGQLLNQAVLVVLLYMCNGGSSAPPYGDVTVQLTLRLSFLLPFISTALLIVHRYRQARNIVPGAEDPNEAKAGSDKRSFCLLMNHYGSRVFATCGAWFCNDVLFYGNKLFQSNFIAVIAPNSKGVDLTWRHNTINCTVELAGYYCAALLIDHRLYGRNTMQLIGFLMNFVLFVVPAFHYDYYTSPEHIHAFQAMYYLSSFFNQFGPNAVTFISAAEVFPSPVRSTAHGVAAATGKAGALLAAVAYSYFSTQQKFYFVPWFGLVGMLITLIFLPDVTGLDLREQERRWRYIIEGRENDYHGIAIHPRHLSLWERLRGVHHNYDAEVDFRNKIEAIREDWVERQRERESLEEDPSSPQYYTYIDYMLSDEVQRYYEMTSPLLLRAHTFRTQKQLSKSLYRTADRNDEEEEYL